MVRLEHLCFPFPSTIKPAVFWETWATKSGLKGSGIFEVETEDFEESINYFYKAFNYVC